MHGRQNRRRSDELAGRDRREEYQRCRYFPHCEIHLGKLPELRALSEVGPGERSDIVAEHARGVPRQTIAEAHRLTYTTVFRMTRETGDGNAERTTRDA